MDNKNVTFQLEPFPEFFKESFDLRLRHYDEICTDKRRVMAIDENEYGALWIKGALQILTVRDEGKLIGYFVTIIRPHSHYAGTIVGYEDAHYLAPEYRKGGIGLRMVREALGYLKASGVDEVIVHTKVTMPTGKLYEHLGFKATDVLYTKRLEDKD